MHRPANLLKPIRADMDKDSSKFAMELMLDDARQSGSHADGMGKQKEGDCSDSQVSFNLYAQELERIITVDANRRRPASVQRGIWTDSAAIRRIQCEEYMADQDQAVAVALSQGRDSPPILRTFPAPLLDTVPDLDPEDGNCFFFPGKGKEKEIEKAVGKGPTAEKPRTSSPANNFKRKRSEVANSRMETNNEKRQKQSKKETETGGGREWTTETPGLANAQKRKRSEVSNSRDQTNDEKRRRQSDTETQKSKGQEPLTEDPSISFPATTMKRRMSGGFDFRDETNNVLIFQGKRLKQGESSTEAASREPTKAQRPCTACMEAKPAGQTVRCPCKHDYCYDCLRDLFTSAIRDESLFPPKCCQQAIPAGKNVEVLGSNVINMYHAKHIEFSTDNRTYCHDTERGSFIKPSDLGTWQKCRKTTCVY